MADLAPRGFVASGIGVNAAVMRATFALLEQKGFQELSIEDVADLAAVHKTSIYRRWGTKEALVLEACLYVAEDATPLPDTGALKTDLVVLPTRK